jgi:hypothetical protein
MFATPAVRRTSRIVSTDVKIDTDYPPCYELVMHRVDGQMRHRIRQTRMILSWVFVLHSSGTYLDGNERAWDPEEAID